jgi:hypothetical protein
MSAIGFPTPQLTMASIMAIRYLLACNMDQVSRKIN